MNIKHIGFALFGIFGLLLAIGIAVIANTYVIALNRSYVESIGVVDGSLNESSGLVAEYERYSNDRSAGEDFTHGDAVVDFVKSVGYTGAVHYYSAENADGKIASEGILSALEWMKNQGVSRVCISLSSSTYSKDLEKWLADNVGTITVYASYNNKLNTVADYPAMYSAVIGVGSDDRVPYKDSDICYGTNKILSVGGGLRVFEGNTYLCAYSAISS